MSEFVWQDQYLIGNPAIDQQHRYLFDLANKLVDSQNQSEQTENAMLLYKHVREHFRAEEEFMKSRHYPAYQKHAETHDMMLNKLIEASKKIHNNDWNRQQVLVFMHDWITHILDEDSAISDHFHSNPS